MKKEVLIIGGGFAGLSAGVELSSRGHHVTLIERKGDLGGRAYSFRDPVTGSTLDNGQHLLMGSFHETLKFLDAIGTLNKVSFRNLSLDFAGPGKGPLRFRTFPLPNPFHLLSGLLFFRGLSFSDKVSAFRLAHACQNGEGKNSEESARLDRLSVTEWLASLHQGEKMRERFLNPLAIAALNDHPDQSSAALFASVLKGALFSGRDAARIGISTVGLSELYTDASRDFIEKRGGQVLLKSPVLRLHFKGGEFQEVELEGGRRISAEVLLVTVPFTALRKILPDEMLYGDTFFSKIHHLQTSPIVAVNLWFDRPITRRLFVGLWGTKMQWLFNKGKFLRDGSPYVALIVSGAREELKIPGPDLVDLAVKELGSVFPEVQKARLLRSLVMKEPEATLAPLVGVSDLRLSQKTPYRNLFLAGDWTDTGLPATIESAVLSAKKAVELIEIAG